jgi:hypothetical protein
VEPRPGDREHGGDHLGHRTVPRAHGGLSGRDQLGLADPGIIGIERYRYEPSGDGYNLYFEHPTTNLAVREIVMYNPRGEQDISSHAFDLLQLSPEEIRRQRGSFASYNLPQAGWRRFLFD